MRQITILLILAMTSTDQIKAQILLTPSDLPKAGDVVNLDKYASIVMILLNTLFVPGITAEDKLLCTNLSDNNCRSFVHISGNTNVSQYNLNLKFPDSQFYLSEKNAGNGKNQIYKIKLPVKQFEANNKVIYNDFMTLLKVNQYPEIIVDIPFDHLLNVASGIPCTEHMISITITGVTNRYTMPGSASFCIDEKIYIYGSKKINLTDFSLIPPEKLMGLIKVEDEIFVDFGFVFKFE